MKLMMAQKVYIGAQRVSVVDYINVRRCGTCYRFNHSTKECDQEAKCCLRCGVSGHLIKDCTKPKPVCCNCSARNKDIIDEDRKYDENHLSIAKECPSLKELERSIRRRIDRCQ